MTTQGANIEWPDIIIIAVYFVAVIGTGIGTSCRNAKTDSAEGYFLAGRSMHWALTGASTWATNIGAPMFIGIAGTASVSGMSIVMFEWHAMFMLIALGWIFLPVYMSSGCFTMPQYLKYRYGGQRIRVWLAVVNIILTIINHIAGQLYAGALFIQLIFQWNLYAAVGLILIVTAIYTIIGGLTAVLWTDAIQTLILIIGSFILAIMGLVQIGGFENLRTQYMLSYAKETAFDVAVHGNRTCGVPREDSFHIFRDHNADYPWPAMVFGLTILATNAWCTDQVCVQRSLSAKNMSHAKAGVLMAAYLKFLPFVFFVIPGMLSRVLYPDEVACADPQSCYDICQNTNGCSDIAYPLLVIRTLPTGVRGIMLAALLSALMSSLTSVFNSSSTLFTMDLWRRCRRGAKERELMIVGRVWTLFLVVIGIAWLPVLQVVKGSQFWNYSQSIGAYILPPIVTVFLFGIFWKRTTEKAAFTGLVSGLGIGIIRMGFTWARPDVPCGSTDPDTRFDIIYNVHFMHFACILMGCTALVILVVSAMTEPRTEAQLRKVTWWTRHDTELPELTSTDSDLSESDEEEKKQTKEPPRPLTRKDKSDRFCLKWFCGIDKDAVKVKLTKEQVREATLALTNIDEDPFWKKFLDINAVICLSVCVFLHGFWA